MGVDGIDWLAKILKNKDGLRRWASPDRIVGRRGGWVFHQGTEAVNVIIKGKEIIDAVIEADFSQLVTIL